MEEFNTLSIEELTKKLSFLFYNETDDKRKDIIRDIMKAVDISNKDLKHKLKKCLISYFAKLANEDLQSEPIVLAGFADLLYAIPTIECSKSIAYIIKQSYVVFVNYDHVLKSAMKKLIYAFALIQLPNQTHDDMMEFIFEDILENGFEYWFEPAFMVFQIQNPKIAATKLETVYDRLTYEVDKVLTVAWKHPKIRARYRLAIKEAIKDNKYWGTRLADTLSYRVIDDKDEVEEFKDFVGYKGYNYTSYEHKR